MSKYLFILFLFSVNLIADENWYNKGSEGWYYYQSSKEKKEKSKYSDPKSAHAAFETQKKELQQSLSRAILDPSQEHVKDYMQKQKQWVDKSSDFASTWQQLLLENPLLGSLEPTADSGLLLKRKVETQSRLNLMHALSDKCFLLFFFEGGDVFSSQAARVVQSFNQLHNWPIKAVSLNGQGLDELESYEEDKGISQIAHVSVTPSYFMVNPEENLIIPIGSGFLSVDQLEKNIELQIQYLKGINEI